MRVLTGFLIVSGVFGLSAEGNEANPCYYAFTRQKGVKVDFRDIIRSDSEKY
jgi:hypothetical protein